VGGSGREGSHGGNLYRPDGSEQRQGVLAIERQELAMKTLGMGLAEEKILMQGVQAFLVAQQVSEISKGDGTCLHCGQRHTSKDSGNTPVKTPVRPNGGAQSTMEPLPNRRAQDIPADHRACRG
jgi:hypothetical protein